MMPSDRATTSFYKLSIVTKPSRAAVWPQFSMQAFNLLVAVSQNRSALPIDSWASCYASLTLNVCTLQTRGAR